MRTAIDPKTDLVVEPNPKARGICPYCTGEVAAHCGGVVAWHWSHIGETCMDAVSEGLPKGGPWAGYSDEVRGTCASCPAFLGVCRRAALWGDRMAVRWRAAWVTETGSVREGAPQCPAWGSFPTGRAARLRARDPHDPVYGVPRAG